MKYLEPNIIIVDDIKTEIQGIIEYYTSIGIGCKVFNPDYSEGDSMPEIPYSDVSVIFLDLYYSDKFDSEQCCNWVRSIIREKSFYILILWTKDASKSNEVLELLQKHNRTPFISIVKSKTEFQTQGAEKYNFTKLFEIINQELENSPALEEVQIWKKSVKYASNEILGNLTKNPDKVIDKLKKIIISHGGKSIIVSDDSERKRSILFDALDTVLISNTKKNVNESISELNTNQLYNLHNIKSIDIDKELNSWFHFKLEEKISKNLISPGLISEFKENDWKIMYSIHDDENILDYLSKQTSTDTKIISIVLLLSRPCDLAQKKYGKNLKLISGLKIINPIRKTNEKKEFQKGSSNIDSVKLYDHLYFNETEKDVAILFDFRYSFSVPEKIFIEQFDNIKVFNKELLSEIQVEYSSYSSRLGITQII